MLNTQKFISLLIVVLTPLFMVIQASPSDGYAYDDYMDGDLIQSTYILIQPDRTTPNTNNNVTCEKSGIYCANDCKTLVACTISNTPITSNKCSDLSRTTPYCIPKQNGCSAIGDSSIAECGIPIKFQCTATGYFPDPTNCSIYYVCTDNFVSVYNCAPRYVYDAKLSKCKLKRFASDCPSINCNNNLVKYLPFPGNKTFFGYCGVNNGERQITMFRCLDPKNFIFNPNTVDCEYVCKGEGWFEDPTNCQGFIECYRSGSRLLVSKRNCPAEYVFDKNVGLCAAGTCP